MCSNSVVEISKLCKFIKIVNSKVCPWVAIDLKLICSLWKYCIARVDPGFQVRGVHLKNCTEWREAQFFLVVFHVKNHDFTPKNHVISNFRGTREIFGVFRVKITILRKKKYFSRGGAHAWILPCIIPVCIFESSILF